jgi:hypothetical protein
LWQHATQASRAAQQAKQARGQGAAPHLCELNLRSVSM